MLQIGYSCDWCKRLKAPGEGWILGFAAEYRGVKVKRRELTIAAQWSEAEAGHRLAVHFCSEEHKDLYVAAFCRGGRPAAKPQRAAKRGRARKKLHAPEAGAQVSVSADAAAAESPAARRRRSAKSRKAQPAAFTDLDNLRARGLGIRLE